MDEMEKNGLTLPDEAEYPRELTEGYDLLELFSSAPGIATLLAHSRTDGGLATVKCFFAGFPLYDQTEPEALKKLNMPPLPRFLGEYKNDQMRCVLHQYVAGETLAAEAARRSLSEGEIVQIGARLCDQLQALHSADPPIIHRDVKPQNIIIQEDGSPVLIDFGISRSQSKKESDTMAFGTRGFAPPEQYGYAQTDARSDIYSLGVVLHWLLHGAAEPIQSASTPLEKVLRRMTAFDPQHRYASAAQAKQALLRVLSHRRKRALLGIAAALALLLGLSILPSAVKYASRQVAFSSPLAAEAVRLNLGLGEMDPVTRDLLAQVKGIYIVADAAYGNADDFYVAVNRWYAEGRPTRGDMKDLADLAQLPNLEQVCVAAQELTDISALAGLKMLNKVEFKHNYIQDIAVLAGLDRLTYVGINDNPVRDISPLLQCPGLTFLDLCGVRSYDPSVIGQLGNFDYLDIANPTASYRYLGRKSIHSLSLAWSGLTTLEDLREVTHLEDLEISHTAVSDLSPVTVHCGLRRLRMAAVPVKSLEPLLRLPQLQSVTLSREMEPLVQELGTPPFEIIYE